jgi:hypothetical protein
MRGALKLGVPIAAGLATGGYALSQGEDPGSAALAAGAGALGGSAGLLGARALAGKYAPGLYKAGLSGKQAADLELLNKAVQLETRQKAEGMPKSLEQKGLEALLSGSANLPIPQQSQFERGLGKAAAAGLVPASALTAGLGGVALGAIPGAMGVPGFQQGGAIDPESPYVSQNPRGLGATTMQYV